MMKGGKTSVLTLAEKCKNVLASNWQGKLNTVKADAKGSKEEIYSSKVKYFVKRGRPYIWVPEAELHNVNAVIDERCSFAVTSPFPGPLAQLLKSLGKSPARLALVGDITLLSDEKVKLAAESVREIIQAEEKALKGFSYSVSQILGSSDLGSLSRGLNLQDLLEGSKVYCVYKFVISSYMYIDGTGKFNEVGAEDIEMSRADPLSLFAMSVIDGINRSEMRRRALILFCITFLKETAKDAFLLSIDRKGFDVLAKVLGSAKNDGSREYQWKQLRFAFKDDAHDVETFCQHLLDMEEEALKNISHLSGI